VFIDSSLNTIKKKLWQPGLIQKSQFMTADSIKRILGQPNGWSYFQKHFGQQIFRFSKPIFFRNNTLCLFYYGNFCPGLCGFESLIIYKKEGDAWESSFVFYQEIH